MIIKRLGHLVLEITILLFATLVLRIAFNSPVAFALGPIAVSARHLRNPVLILIALLVIRRLIAGSVFSHWTLIRILRQGSDFVARPLATSPRLRRILSGLLLCAMLGIGTNAVLNPVQQGLIGHYYDTPDWSGEPLLTRCDTTFNLWWKYQLLPEPREHYSIEWTGVIFIPRSATYQFMTASDDGSELWIDGRLVVDNGGMHGVQERHETILLQAGFHSIRLRYAQGIGDAHLKAYWGVQDREMQELSTALLFPEEPESTVFYISYSLILLDRVSTFIVTAFLIIGAFMMVFSHDLLAPIVQASRVGRWSRRVRNGLFLRFVPNNAFPVPAQRKWYTAGWALLGYCALAVFWLAPMSIHFSTSMVGRGGDRYIHLWNMWWMKKALLNALNPLFTDYLFYPEGISLAFHDFSPLNALFSLPLQVFFSRPEIYNLLFLSTFTLGGFGAFLLIRYLTGDALAAFIGGVVYVFWAGRANYADHLSLASIHWMPYCVLYLLKSLRERSWRNPLLAALFLVMNALSSWYYAVYMALFTALFLGYAAWKERRLLLTSRCILRFFVIGLLGVIAMSPFLAPMFRELSSGEGYMNSALFAEVSANLDTLLLPNFSHPLLGKYVDYYYAVAGLALQGGLVGNIFLGYTVLLLAIYAGCRLRHLNLSFWFLVVFVFLLLACGPYLRVFSQEYHNIPLPYLLLNQIPLLKIVRIPIRFIVLVMLGLSVLAGYGCWDLLRRIRFRRMGFTVILFFVLFEFLRIYPVDAPETAPKFYERLGQDNESYAILELTRLMNWEHSSTRSSLFQTVHEKKLFHGHVSRVSRETYHQAYLLYPIFDDLFTCPEEYLYQAPETTPLLVPQKEILMGVLSFFNVRYLALYHDYSFGDFHTNQYRLDEVLNIEQIVREQGIAFYPVDPTPLTRNVAFPGFGMLPLHYEEGEPPVRQTALQADIHLLNVEEASHCRLRFAGKSFRQPREQVEISINGTRAATVTVGDWTEFELEALPLNAGHNIIRFHTLENGDDKYGVQLRDIAIEYFNQ